jgi:hypothetical protein
VAADERSIVDEWWLLGQPALRDYLSFVSASAVDGEAIPAATLVDEWRAANDHYQELEEQEAGVADDVPVLDLDPALAPLVEEVTASPAFRRTFDALPTRIGLVELDRLVAFQRSVTGDFVLNTAARLGPAPRPEDVLRLCLPVEGRPGPVRVERLGSRRFVLRSDSMDLRVHEARVLRPDQLRDYESFGPIAGVAGLVVGFGSNLLNAILADGRLLLHNGYHRACALRSLGVTHVPCVVQEVTRPDELELVARGEILERADLYFAAPRPPLLKDFFDPQLRKVVRCRRARREVEVTIEVRETLVS